MGISLWDVSSVTDMNSMFNGANSFNQDLSRWCVPNITSALTNFGNAGTDPVWGTCPLFYIGANGVTVVCTNASAGDTGTINGVTYTKRTRAQITEANAATTCTSGITDMSGMFKFARTFNGIFRRGM